MREQDIHRHVCDYLKLQYPAVLFQTDFASGMKLPMGLAVRRKAMASGRAWPDLFIAETRSGKAGLFIELKKPGGKGVLKDGSLSTTVEHIVEQRQVLEALRARGYVAEFAVGFDQARQIIDDYLKD